MLEKHKTVSINKLLKLNLLLEVLIKIEYYLELMVLQVPCKIEVEAKYQLHLK